MKEGAASGLIAYHSGVSAIQCGSMCTRNNRCRSFIHAEKGQNKTCTLSTISGAAEVAKEDVRWSKPEIDIYRHFFSESKYLTLNLQVDLTIPSYFVSSLERLWAASIVGCS